MVSRASGTRDTRLRRVVTVEIGWTAVRAAEVEVRGHEARILRGGAAPIASTVWDDLAAHHADLTNAVRQALHLAGIRSKSAVISLPRRMVTVKYARLPQGSPEHVAGMVRYEAQQYIPFPVDEVVLDHQILSDPSEDMATVMIVAARRSLVNDVLGAFDRAGVEVTRVSVSTLALAELLHADPLPTAICRLDGSQLDMAVGAAGRVLFSRSAELVEPSTGAELLDQVAAELARSLAAYQTEYRAHAVDRVVVASDSAQPADLVEALSPALQVQVSLLEPAVGSREGAGGDAVVVGLALEEAHPESTINLLPPERIRRKVEARRRTATRLALVALLLAVLGGAWYGQQALDAQAKERRRAVFENTRLRRVQPLVKESQNRLERLRRMYLTVNYGLGRDRPVVDVIKAISDALPRGTGVRLTQLTFDRGGPVVLHGTAPTQEAVTDFLLGLQTAGVFKEARLGYLGDAGSTGRLSAASSSTPTASGGEAGMSFMLYCRLPEPPTLEEKATVLRRNRPTESASTRVLP